MGARPPQCPNPTSADGEILKPAASRPAPELTVVVDTSGSMSPNEYA